MPTRRRDSADIDVRRRHNTRPLDFAFQRYPQAAAAGGMAGSLQTPLIRRIEKPGCLNIWNASIVAFDERPVLNLVNARRHYTSTDLPIPLENRRRLNGFVFESHLGGSMNNVQKLGTFLARVKIR